MKINTILITIISLLVIAIVTISLVRFVRNDNKPQAPIGIQQQMVTQDTNKEEDAQAVTQPQAGNTTPVPAKGYVYFLGTEFYPSQITLKKGESMSFINRTPDAAEFEAQSIQVPELNSLGIFTHTFTEAGRFTITPKGKTSPVLTITVQ